MAMTPEQKELAEKREATIKDAAAKHLKVKPEEVLSIGYMANGPAGEHTYAVLLADKPKRGPIRGKRVYIDATKIGKTDDLMKQKQSAETSG